MPTEAERLNDRLNQVLARYAELKHAASVVTRLYRVAALREHEMNLAVQELQACIDAPLITTEGEQ